MAAYCPLPGPEVFSEQVALLDPRSGLPELAATALLALRTDPVTHGSLRLERSTDARHSICLVSKIYADEGIAQIIFLEADEVCETSYKDKKGKYQAQKRITLPRL